MGVGGPVISRGLIGGMVTFCVSGIIVWRSSGVVALLQIVAISVVDNPRVDIQGNSEKCTGAFKFGCRKICYFSKICRKSGLIH